MNYNDYLAGNYVKYIGEERKAYYGLIGKILSIAEKDDPDIFTLLFKKAGEDSLEELRVRGGIDGIRIDKFFLQKQGFKCWTMSNGWERCEKDDIFIIIDALDNCRIRKKHATIQNPTDANEVIEKTEVLKFVHSYQNYFHQVLNKSTEVNL